MVDLHWLDLHHQCVVLALIRESFQTGSGKDSLLMSIRSPINNDSNYWQHEIARNCCVYLNSCGLAVEYLDHKSEVALTITGPFAELFAAPERGTTLFNFRTGTVVPIGVELFDIDAAEPCETLTQIIDDQSAWMQLADRDPKGNRFPLRPIIRSTNANLRSTDARSDSTIPIRYCDRKRSSRDVERQSLSALAAVGFGHSPALNERNIRLPTLSLENLESTYRLT